MRLQLVLGHEVEKLLAVAFGVVAAGVRVPLVVFKEAVHHYFVYIRGLIIGDMLLETEEELLELVVVTQVWEMKQHSMGVFGVHKSRQDE